MRETEERKPSDELLPRETVAYLDKYIVGQKDAKRAVAKALRDRWRRGRLPAELQPEVMPKNILMIGPTGVGKTEVARRLARLIRAPFIKVEASKFTEVGYVGRDVESMVRDLADAAVAMTREEETKRVGVAAARNAEERLLDLLLPKPKPRPLHVASPVEAEEQRRERREEEKSWRETREKMREKLRLGHLDDRTLTVPVTQRSMPAMEIVAGGSIEEINRNLRDMMQDMFAGRSREKTMTVREARDFVQQEEEQKLVDMERIQQEALRRAEQEGIIFIDEIDKISGREQARGGPDVSREGVQRDLLPVVEGTTVMTKYGPLKTDYILFIASGAFHVSRPSDLIPELQGRFPIRVHLDPLTRDDFVRILKEPENSLVRQYTAMMATEGVEVEITAEAVEAAADIAFRINQSTENIGARRLHTVMERLFDEISFAASEAADKSPRIDAEYVRRVLAEVASDQDLSRYIL
jgi:ATP-dependent HslUV protease ATP-binding subunit HslU